jgi:type IV secretion system protein VirB10
MSYGMNVRTAALFALGSLVIAAPLFAERSGQQAPADQTSPDQAKPDQATQSPSSAAPAANSTAANNAPPANTSAQFIVPSGTRLPLVLHNAISTRNAQPGDPVYLETVFPVILNGRIAIPAGSYVQGEVTEAKRPGKGKGTGEVRIRLTTLILPNGYTVNFDAIPTNTGTNGGEYADKEGQITKDRDRAADAGTVIKTTGAGAGIGGIAGGARGLGVGAGVGAAVGLAAVLMSRGPDLELPRGTSVDIMLDRPLPLDPSKINFTDPGHASSLPGPPTRQPTRSFPF